MARTVAETKQREDSIHALRTKLLDWLKECNVNLPEFVLRRLCETMADASQDCYNKGYKDGIQIILDTIGELDCECSPHEGEASDDDGVPSKRRH